MAEALAAIGLASALVSFIDFSSKVVRQLRQFEQEVSDQPKVFAGIRTRLPLMIDLVNKIILRMHAGMIDQATEDRMLPIIRECEQQAKQLDELLRRALPTAGDSAWKRGKKAILGVVQENEMEKLDAGLKRNFDLLLQADTFHAVSRLDRKDSVRHNSASFTMNPTFNLNMNVDETVRRRSSAMDSLPPYEDWKRKDSQPNQVVFNVPFPRDNNFLGRQSVIGEIHKRFENQRFVSLAGLGGIGKSQVAIEFSYIFKEQNPDAHVFWVYAGNSVRFEQGYRDIARKLFLPGRDDDNVNTLELVHDWMSNEQSGQWLLILDNADDAALFFKQRDDGREFSNEREYSISSNKTLARYLPNASYGFVLITTRDMRVGERLSSREKPIEVGFMSASESVELLRSRIMEEDWDESDGQRLAKELLYLPLGLSQASAFISENHWTVSEYLDTLHSGKDDMEDLLSEHLEDSRRDLDTENSVMRTWKLSFDHISKTSPRAADMLSLLSVLDLQGAPLSLLREKDEKPTGFRKALGALQALSLVNAGRGKDALCKMHRLVALSTRRWLEISGTLSHWRSEALKRVEERFPSDCWSTPGEWAYIETLVPHAQVVLSFPVTTTDDLLCSARLLGACSLFDMSKSKYEDAYKKSRRALDIREAQLSSDDPLVLESIQMVGESLLHRGYPGDLHAAKEALTKAVDGRETKLGSLHPDTLESVSDLTITLLALEELDSAMATAQRALKGREEVLGPHDRDTIVSLNICALALQQSGRLDEARMQMERVLEIRQRLLGPEHPDTLMTSNNLARLYTQQGELQAAEALLRRVLEGEAKVLGAEGYDSQVSFSNLALVQQEKGEFDNAEATFRKVLAMRTKSFGPEHSSTVLTLRRLAELFDRKGDKSSYEAVNLRLKALSIGDANKQPRAGALLRAGLLFD